MISSNNLDLRSKISFPGITPSNESPPTEFKFLSVLGIYPTSLHYSKEQQCYWLSAIADIKYQWNRYYSYPYDEWDINYHYGSFSTIIKLDKDFNFIKNIYPEGVEGRVWYGRPELPLQASHIAGWADEKGLYLYLKERLYTRMFIKKINENTGEEESSWVTDTGKNRVYITNFSYSKVKKRLYYTLDNIVSSFKFKEGSSTEFNEQEVHYNKPSQDGSKVVGIGIFS